MPAAQAQGPCSIANRRPAVLMIGRGKRSQPWAVPADPTVPPGRTLTLPTGRDGPRVCSRSPPKTRVRFFRQRESSQVQRLKKFMNFVADGGRNRPVGFLHQIQRGPPRCSDFFHVCTAATSTMDRPLALEPLPQAQGADAWGP